MPMTQASRARTAARRRSGAQRGAALGLGLLLSAKLVGATTLVHFDTAGLTRNADQIVVGTVADVRSYWNPAHTRILTDIGISVSETVKGAAAPRLVITQLGGEVDGVKVTLAGCPAFHPGEEALLFVTRDRAARSQLTGLAQGKFEIVRDRMTGERLIQRRMEGFAISDVRGLRSVPIQSTQLTLKLDDLVREIRSAIARKGE